MRKNLWILVSVAITLITLSPLRVKAQYIHGFSIDWQPNGSLIAQVFNGELTLLDSRSLQELPIPQSIENNSINFAVWNMDGTQLAVVDISASISIWNVQDNMILDRPIAVYAGFQPDDYLFSINWSPDGRWIAISAQSVTYSLQILDAITFEPVLRVGPAFVTNAIWNPQGDTLAISDVWGVRLLRSTQLNTQFSGLIPTYADFISQTESIGPNRALVGIAWDPTGNLLAMGDYGGGVNIYDIQDNNEISRLENLDRSITGARISVVSRIEWHGDRLFVTTDNGNGGMNVWDMTTYQRLASYPNQYGFVHHFSLSPYSAQLVTVDETGTSNIPHIMVPSPTIQQLQSIATVCAAPLAIEQSLTADVETNQLSNLITQLESLPVDSIPPACAADLIAVAEAIQNQ